MRQPACSHPSRRREALSIQHSAAQRQPARPTDTCDCHLSADCSFVPVGFRSAHPSYYHRLFSCPLVLQPAQLPGKNSRPVNRNRLAQRKQQVARIAELRRVHEAFAWFRSHARELEELQLAGHGHPRAALGRSGAQRMAEARFAELCLSECPSGRTGQRLRHPARHRSQRSLHRAQRPHRHRFPGWHTDRRPARRQQALRPRHLRQRLGHGRPAGDCRRLARHRHRHTARRFCSSATLAKRAKATCAACDIFSSSRNGRPTSRRWWCSTAPAPTPSLPKGWAAAATRSRCAATAAIPGATSAWPIPSSRWRASSTVSAAPRCRRRPRRPTTSASSAAALR